jgi:hypothetical protein
VIRCSVAPAPAAAPAAITGIQGFGAVARALKSLEQPVTVTTANQVAAMLVSETGTVVLTSARSSEVTICRNQHPCSSTTWGGWGSNPRPVDYEETGPPRVVPGGRPVRYIAPGQSGCSGTMRTGQDRLERDECYHNVLTQRSNYGSLTCADGQAGQRGVAAAPLVAGTGRGAGSMPPDSGRIGTGQRPQPGLAAPCPWPSPSINRRQARPSRQSSGSYSTWRPCWFSKGPASPPILKRALVHAACPAVY